MKAFTSILHALETRPALRPHQQVFAYANEQGDIIRRLTWASLSEAVDTLTGYLRVERKLNVGERVLLVYPPSMDFVIAFSACLRAGLVPVPVYPPNPRKLNSGMEAFHRIAHDCDAKLILTSQQYESSRNRGGVQELMAQDPSRWSLQLDWVATDLIEPGSFSACHGPAPQPSDVALIQYTSGSTSAPKGVVITHENLAHQVDYTRRAMKLNAHSRAVFWVPQYHDLGLIGGIMTALAGHVELTLFSPFAFIKRPALWFDLIHATRATHTAGPNFAYDLALQKTTPEQRAQWDLSCLEVVMSAAEPVRAGTLKRFVDGFSCAGLKPRAYLPAYGLAEHTVGVTFNGGSISHFDRYALEHNNQVIELPEGDENAIELVSNGTWTHDIDLQIVNNDTHQPCQPNQVGEIWVNSPSKAAGYWQMPDENARSFEAKLAPPADSHPVEATGYLRTGDLGFIHQGELYVCSRVKDLLIMAGRNIYPQDIEDSVEALDHCIKPVATAAFTIDVVKADTVEEKLVLLVDIRKLKASKEELESMASALQSKILEEHQIACHAIAICPIGTVLKTTSGKVRRQACRQQWLKGELSDKALYLLQSNANHQEQQQSHLSKLAENAPRPQIMQAAAADILNLPQVDLIDIHLPLTDQGMGSLAAVDFCQLYEQASGEELSITQFFNAPSITGMCDLLENNTRPALTLDEAFAIKPDDQLIELHAVRHYLRNNRYCQSGFRLGQWAVRPATVADVPGLHKLDQQEYGWLGEDATDSADFIQHQVQTLNQFKTPWFWVLEKRSQNPHSKTVSAELVGWYILQPTHLQPGDITSWAQATSEGTFADTFDPDGKNLYLVAAGISRRFTKQAHRIMVLNALSLMAVHGKTSVSACLAMPGFAEAHQATGIAPENYLEQTDTQGMPKDAFLAFFKELWPGEHAPLRLLRNGYPPDQLSGGHGVCASVHYEDQFQGIDAIIDQLVQHRAALFGESEHTDTATTKPELVASR